MCKLGRGHDVLPTTENCSSGGCGIVDSAICYWSLAGERIQVHRKGNECKFFSRNALDHGMKSSYDILIPVFEEQVKPGDFILDGELIVWNKSQ